MLKCFVLYKPLATPPPQEPSWPAYYLGRFSFFWAFELDSLAVSKHDNSRSSKEPLLTPV